MGKPSAFPLTEFLNATRGRPGRTGGRRSWCRGHRRWPDAPARMHVIGRGQPGIQRSGRGGVRGLRWAAWYGKNVTGARDSPHPQTSWRFGGRECGGGGVPRARCSWFGRNEYPTPDGTCIQGLPSPRCGPLLGGAQHFRPWMRARRRATGKSKKNLGGRGGKDSPTREGVLGTCAGDRWDPGKESPAGDFAPRRAGGIRQVPRRLRRPHQGRSSGWGTRPLR